MYSVEFKINQGSKLPLHLQIAEQVRRLIATGKLKPGDRLPPVRQLAEDLNINQNTVLKAYALLEQEKIIAAHRGGGTIVLANANDPNLVSDRKRRLLELVNNDILNALSLGYNPEDIESAFYTNLVRWRKERKPPPFIKDNSNSTEKPKTIKIIGSHDMALDILTDLTRKRRADIEFQITHAGSLGGLIALQEERAHLAGIHLLDEETGEYNLPYIKRILPGRELAVIHLVDRIQGLMYARGNPKRITSITDLDRPDISFVNRQQGTGTRALLDIHLHQLGINPKRIKGYGQEMDTHLAVGLCVARGEADVSLGIEAAARTCNIDFLPLFKEKYDLVMTLANYRDPLFTAILNTINSQEFIAVVNKAGGYDTSQTGTTAFL